MIRGAVKDKVKVKVTDVRRLFRSNECKPPVILLMMMMMTFHNFAGYEFIFAFKQPDVTYVTSSLFLRSG